MNDQASHAQTAQTLGETSSQKSLHSVTQDDLASAPRTIRYMDDATFDRCLDEVMTIHDRLLAKLAE